MKTKVAYFSLFEKLADFSHERDLQTSLPVQNEDYFEWIDLLESVLSSNETFRMIELGAGWGRWLANGIAAARQIGRDYEAIGVEAEPKHVAWMRDHLRVNGVDLARVKLVRAAVAAEAGHVWFHVGDSADWYGQRVEDSPPENVVRRVGAISAVAGLRSSGKRRLRKTRAVSLNMLLAGTGFVDLVDSDVQGSEADVFEAAGPALDRRVRRVHIGTHSVDNEERLRRFFGSRGWEPYGTTLAGP